MADTRVIRAYILITLKNGRTIKYINDAILTANGLQHQYYEYGVGEEFSDQTGTDEIKTDYDAIISSITGATDPDIEFLQFPDSTPSTTLTRYNLGRHLETSASSYVMAKTMTSVIIGSIATVEVIEEDAIY